MSYNQSKPYDNSKNNNDNVNDSYNDNDNNNDKDNDNVNFWSSCLIFCKKIFRKSHITDTIIRMSKHQSPLTSFVLFWRSTLTQMIRTHAQVLRLVSNHLL